MLRRFVFVLTAVVTITAAPLRAWCEASCVAPVTTESHCPSHQPRQDGTAISSVDTDDCASALESARSTPVTRT
ncbi:MAG TPA: hypothetical protein VEA16_05700, partial [Vicinamibacterales bacterium]|nr:hypothetical protein [Vicinamibacterales bacterium]